MKPTTGPLPGQPETYPVIEQGREEIVLVPINDRARHRTLFAKVGRRSFDGLPKGVRSASWFIVMDGTATDDKQFSIRVRQGRTQVSLTRLIMAAQPGEYVRQGSDRLDLRTHNLQIKYGAKGRRSKRHDLAIAVKQQQKEKE